jgi:hypothetical protein
MKMASFLVRARNRARALVRRLAFRAEPVATRAGQRCLYAVPLSVRHKASRTVLRVPREVQVPTGSLLLGEQNGLTARQFADRTGDLLWPSTRLVDGPHMALLRLAQQRGAAISDEEILASPYGRFGLRCIELNGQFFWASDPAGVVDVARSFMARFRGAQPQVRLANQSGPDDQVLVARVRGSDCYQVLDGHHRVATEIARGQSSMRAALRWTPVTTPLQQLLRRMSWLEGTRALYQPLDAPELRRGWVTVRRCTDRLGKMRAFLAERRLLPPVTVSYLDVASCYGWFVGQMRDLGYVANGMERDPLAVPLGQAAYSLDPSAVMTGDCVELLRSAGRTWSVVSCFSLLHHFVLGRGSTSPEELLKLLDGTTERVLFLDTGQEHEAWMQRSLRGWSPEFIARYLREHTTFDEIIDLGPDEDAVGRYADNYGRHLFACVRTE